MKASSDLQKFIWDDNDLEQMDWHDSKIYAIAFDEERFELILDIDYITKWIDPNKDESYFKFCVAPATLVFSNVRNINIDLSSIDFQIQDIQRSNPTKPKNGNSMVDKFEYDG